jgi:apolipoprotein N-acyltransferase
MALAGSAYLMALAIEPPHRVWLGWITLLPLFYAIRVLPPARAMISGAFWGACLFVFSVAFATTEIAPSLGAFVLLSLIPGAYGYFGAALTRRIGFSPFLLALGWIGAEFALAPLGLRHGLLAGTQGDGLAISLIGSVAGYALVAFLVAYVNASLLSVLTSVRRGAPSSRLIRGAGDTIRAYSPIDLPSYLLHIHRQAQPRAPPI